MACFSVEGGIIIDLVELPYKHKSHCLVEILKG